MVCVNDWWLLSAPRPSRCAPGHGPDAGVTIRQARRLTAAWDTAARFEDLLGVLNDKQGARLLADALMP
jgi:hypothetical protein